MAILLHLDEVERERAFFHAGLIVRSTDAERVRMLLEAYKERFAQDFLTSVPLPEKGRV